MASDKSIAPFGAKGAQGMDQRILFGRSAVALAVAALAGCSGGGGDGGASNGSATTPGTQSSTLSVSLMDAPVDGVTAVYVEITSMWIKPTGDGPAVQLPLENGPLTVNLLELTDENAAILIDEAIIEPGSYEWLAMDIAATPNRRDSYVLTNYGGEEEIDVEHDLFVPSGRMRLVSGFEVPPNSAVQLLFDWDLRKGLVYPPGLGRYLLKPAFRMLDVTAFGVLEGTIAADTIGEGTTPETNACAVDGEDLDVGNIVYVFEGSVDAEDLNDVDGSDDDPIATIEAERQTNGDYTYRTLINPGTYTVVFTCQGGNDDPEVADDEVEFLQPAEPTSNPVENNGGTTTVNFEPVEA
jgi:hypothetical protein